MNIDETVYCTVPGRWICVYGKGERVIFPQLTPILENIAGLKKYVNAGCVNYLWLFYITISNAAFL